jgi:hypothetical protein
MLVIVPSASYSDVMYSRNRIGERGEPCGTPAGTGSGVDSSPSKARVAVRFVK